MTQDRLRAALQRAARGIHDAIQLLGRDAAEALPAPLVLPDSIPAPLPGQLVRRPAPPLNQARAERVVDAHRPEIAKAIRLAIIAHPGQPLSRIAELLGSRYPYLVVQVAAGEMATANKARREGRGALARWYIDDATQAELTATQPEEYRGPALETRKAAREAILRYLARAPGATVRGIKAAVLPTWTADAIRSVLEKLERRQWVSRSQHAATPANTGWFLGIEAPVDRHGGLER